MVTIPSLKGYPKHLLLRDSTPITIRLMEPGDKIRLLKFFEGVSEEDRHYLKENVTAPEVIQSWTSGINLQRVIPIVALEGDAIVADGTLHRSRAPARQHVGEIRLVVAPASRERGLGTRMIRELIDHAASLGLHKVFFELVARREEQAIGAAKSMGFGEAAVLQEAAKDYWGNLQDLVILEYILKDAELWWRY